MDTTTSAEVAGDSFRDLRVLLYDLRSLLAAARMGAELLIRLDLSEKQNQRVARNVLAATMRVEEILSDLALLMAGAAIMSSKDAQFQPNVAEQFVQARGRGLRLGTAGSRGISVGGPTKEIGGFNMIDFSLRQRIVRPGSVLATALFLALLQMPLGLI
jgi:hypothetical protein